MMASWTDLVPLVLQTALLLAVGVALPEFLRLRQPWIRLAYWRLLLALILFLPLGAFFGDTPRVMAERLQVSPLWIDVSTNPIAPDATSSAFGGLLWVLVLGAVVRLAWFFLGLASLQRLRRKAQPIVPWPASLRAAQALVGQDARFLSSDRIGSPVTFGWLRPVVLLPKEFENLSGEAQESVICHELLHVARRDWLVHLVEEVLRALFWFHPAVRLLLGRIDLCREQVIDQQVVRLLDRRRPYLQALWTFGHGPNPALPAAVNFFNQGHLLARVTLLTQEVRMSRFHIALSSTALLVALAFTTALGLSLFPWSSAAHAGEKAIHHVEGDVQKPIRIHGDVPSYPEAAREDRIEGQVVVQSVINTEGIVESMKVVSSPGPAFSEAVSKIMPSWRFEPARLDGEPVDVYYNLTFNFRLDKEKQTED